MIRIVTNYREIYEVLNYYSKDLEAIKAGRIDLEEMAKKFTAFGTVIELIKEEERVGFAAFYHNDRKLRRAFLSMIVVLPAVQGRGYGGQLLTEVEHECIDDGMRILAVQVGTEYQKAGRLYKKRGFKVTNALSEERLIMEKTLV